MSNPLGISAHGRIELVLLAVREYERLLRGEVETAAATLEAKLSMVLDTVRTNIMILDHECRVRRLNRSVRLALGLDEHMYRGRFVGDLLPASQAPFIVGHLRDVVRTGRETEIDFASVLNPGRIIHARIVPWPGGIAYYSEDVTDRIVAFDNEMERAAMLSALACLGGRGSGRVGPDGLVRHADAGLSALLGATESSLDGRRFVSIFDPSNRSRIEAALGKYSPEPVLVDVRFLRDGVELQPGRLAMTMFFAHDSRQFHAFVLST